MSTVQRISAHPEIQTILNAWSRTLLLDAESGESIITEPDLNHLTTILSRYFVHTLTSIKTSEISQTSNLKPANSTLKTQNLKLDT
jgi:hypothetical protein